MWHAYFHNPNRAWPRTFQERTRFRGGTGRSVRAYDIIGTPAEAL
jgi:hypothetical protein